MDGVVEPCYRFAHSFDVTCLIVLIVSCHAYSVVLPYHLFPLNTF